MSNGLWCVVEWKCEQSLVGEHVEPTWTRQCNHQITVWRETGMESNMHFWSQVALTGEPTKRNMHPPQCHWANSHPEGASDLVHVHLCHEWLNKRDRRAKLARWQSQETFPHWQEQGCGTANRKGQGSEEQYLQQEGQQREHHWHWQWHCHRCQSSWQDYGGSVGRHHSDQTIHHQKPEKGIGRARIGQSWALLKKQSQN